MTYCDSDLCQFVLKFLYMIANLTLSGLRMSELLRGVHNSIMCLHLHVIMYFFVICEVQWSLLVNYTYGRVVCGLCILRFLYMVVAFRLCLLLYGVHNSIMCLHLHLIMYFFVICEVQWSLLVNDMKGWPLHTLFSAYGCGISFMLVVEWISIYLSKEGAGGLKLLVSYVILDCKSFYGKAYTKL